MQWQRHLCLCCQMAQTGSKTTTRKLNIGVKGPVKLMQLVKIAHSFLQSVSNLFHFIILSLPVKFYTWLSKNFSKPTSKNGEICHFNWALLIESF